MKKSIIGLMGNKEDRIKAAEILCKMGFFRLSIEKKVREISKYLLKDEEKISEELFGVIRNKGYKVNRLYWINIALVSVPEEVEKVVIEDIRLEDIIDNVVYPYYILADGKNLEKLPSNIEVLHRENDPKSFKAMIEKKFKNISAKSTAHV